MKPLYLSVVAPLLIYVACADEEVPPGPSPSAGGKTSTGGTVGTTGGTVGTTGGTVGTTGGTVGTTGGTAGTTGGTASPTGGSGGQPGGGMAGKSSTGGAAGGGGTATGGSGGMSTGGTSGGDTSQGGGGGAGTAGMGGTGGAGTDLPTPATLAPGLDGHLITTPCKANPDNDDCDSSGWRSSAVNNFAPNACVGGTRLEALINFPVGGVAGTKYDVTMHFYGVMEPRQYANVMREAPGDPNLNGGTPTPWAEAPGGTTITGAGDQNYNTYEIHVYDQNDMEVRGYYLNADNGTGHYTMLINYEKTIEVIGGGEVRLRIFDANCRMIKNCGSAGGWPCANDARSIDISAASPAPPANQLMQPGLGLAPEESGQWWLIDVTKVALAAP